MKNSNGDIFCDCCGMWLGKDIPKKGMIQKGILHFQDTKHEARFERKNRPKVQKRYGPTTWTH